MLSMVERTPMSDSLMRHCSACSSGMWSLRCIDDPSPTCR